MKYRFNKDKELTLEYIKKFIELDAAEQARKCKLYDYYKGKHAITKRYFEDPSKPNNKVVNPYPRYITTLMTGYFMGEPVEYSSQDEAFLAPIVDVLKYNDESQVNKSIAKNQSIFGVGAELMYIDNDNMVRFESIPPIGLIGIYDSYIGSDLIYAIRYWEEIDVLYNDRITHIEVYSDAWKRTYIKEHDSISLVSEEPHMFGLVPVNFYMNNDEELGDFETVISEIDAYDAFESDSVNEADYFADSYLMLSGMEGTTSEDVGSMKENRVMVLPEGGNAAWLTKQINDSWIENEKKRLDQDIHKFSFCPPMTDENFANNASGVAMRYKLMGLENCVATKESEFEKGLRRRIELISSIKRKTVISWSIGDVNIIFTRNLPQDLDSAVATVNLLDGVISDETRLSLLPLDIDVQAELEKVEEQKQSNFSLFGANFNEVSEDDEATEE